MKPKRTSNAVRERVDTALATVALGDVRDQKPAALSQGQRKLVGVARALAAGPRLLLLDEPAAGLDNADTRRLGDRIRGIASTGPGVLLVDHDIGLVLTVCDYIYVLDFGRIIAEGTPAEVRSNPAVIAAYLGESAGEEQAREGTAVGRAGHVGEGQ